MQKKIITVVFQTTAAFQIFQTRKLNSSTPTKFIFKMDNFWISLACVTIFILKKLKTNVLFFLKPGS